MVKWAKNIRVCAGNDVSGPHVVIDILQGDESGHRRRALPFPPRRVWMNRLPGGSGVGDEGGELKELRVIALFG